MIQEIIKKINNKFPRLLIRIVFLIVFLLVLGIVKEGYLDITNIFLVITQQAPYYALLAFGMTTAILLGGIDLSLRINHDSRRMSMCFVIKINWEYSFFASIINC